MNDFKEFDPFNIHNLAGYIKKFLTDMKSMPRPDESVVVGVSGGRDSMLLLKLMSVFKEKKWIKDVSAIHLDYLTRGEERWEIQDGLHQYCYELGVKLDVIEHELSIDASNFEMKARDIRFEHFKNALKNNSKAWVVLAHHIDDSFEWSLMQQAKTNSLKSTLGIPLKRGRFLRPFMCLTREQIGKICRANKIYFWDDPSNESVKFERNWFRKNIVAPLKERNPKILKHYVNQHNEMAFKFSLHAKQAAKFKNASKQSFDRDLEIQKFFGGVVIIDKSGKRFVGKNEIITSWVKKLSFKKRGKLGSEITKITDAINKGRSGPLFLSGGVKVHLGPDRILLSTKDFSWFSRVDKEIAKKLNNASDIPVGSLISKKLSRENNFTEYVILKNPPKELSGEVLRGTHVMLKTLQSKVKQNNYTVIRQSRLKYLCQKRPDLKKESVQLVYC